MAIQKNSLITILNNSLKKGYASVICNKIRTRILEPSITIQKRDALKWCNQVATSQKEFCAKLDAQLYDLSLAYNNSLISRTKSRLDQLPVKMGGSADVVLTYFLARYFQPEIIVETGVSMGFSSRTFLEFINENGRGQLFSSDFPYFRLKEPEQYIGWVVPEELRNKWSLFIEGDRKNIKNIIKKIDKIDLFHYDSDKSYSGRKETWNMVLPLLKPESIIVFDDIDDNLHFKNEIYDVYEDAIVLSSRSGGYVGVLMGLKTKAH